MRAEFLPFTRPAVNDDDIAAVTEVLRSGWLTNGPKNAEFERAIADYTGHNYAVALSSATAGMHILLKALNIGPGDEVITPSLTWVSTVNMIELSGATPVFADVDRDTLMITPESVKAKITERTKLIIPVHYAGAPADLDGIRAVAGGIRIVEDAAHALGTFYKGTHIGQSGTAIYSFHAIKNITTGEGGMVVTDDEELFERLKMLKFHGIRVDAFDRENRGRSPQSEVSEPGYKYNMTDMSAALGLSQFKRLEEINARRTELAMRYRKLFAGVQGVLPLGDVAYDHVHAWHLFIVRVVAEHMDRDTFMAAMKAENIGTGLHFRCAHLQKYYREVKGYKPGMLPETEWNSDRICSLPLFPGMALSDVDDVVAATRKVLGE